MRLLIAGSVCFDRRPLYEIDCYLNRGMSVVVNTRYYSAADVRRARDAYAGSVQVAFDDFDLASAVEVTAAVLAGDVGFDAIVWPPSGPSVPPGLIQAAATDGRLTHRLRAIGCPSDALGNLRDIAELARANDVAIIHTPDVHARSVAEYTLIQFGLHARKISHFHQATGDHGAWPHAEAASSTHLIHVKTVGVIGGAGKDGRAVITLAHQVGLEVVATGSGSLEGLRRLQGLGARVASDVGELLACADFVSINCRLTDQTRGMIGNAEIKLMKPGVVIVNPSRAEVLECEAILREFSLPSSDRRVGALVLDMPYGGSWNAGAFAADPSNAALRERGVFFSPRMAGYTVESQCQAIADLAGYLERFVRLNDRGVPIANRPVDHTTTAAAAKPTADDLLEDIVSLVRQAGAEAMRLRDCGLTVKDKDDGSPTTNADVAAEELIKAGLIASGYRVAFRTEEGTEAGTDGEEPLVIIDGIDGTRNFRDGNYGWCVSVGVRRREGTEIGVVYDPLTGEVFGARRGAGAFVDDGSARRPFATPQSLPPDFSFSVGSFRVAGSTAKKAKIIDGMKGWGGREPRMGLCRLVHLHRSTGVGSARSSRGILSGTTMSPQF